MLKKLAFLFVAIVLCSHLQGTGKDFTTSTWPDCNEVETMQGGYINYEGTIGPYKVDFMFMNLHMGNGIEFYYTYKTIVVNKGEPIQLFYQKNKGDYEIWYEYINGRHTGTFTIVKTKEKIFGTFKNSKGKTYKVSAHMTDSNYADE